MLKNIGMSLKKRKLAILCIGLIFIIFFPHTVLAAKQTAPVIADEAGQVEQEDEVVDIRPPRSYYTKKILLFPLHLPGYVVRTALWPLAFSFKQMEKYYVFERAADFLSNDEKTFLYIR